MTPSEAADLIERFLNNAPAYPQEWNDFIEARRVDQRVEQLRKKCYELDPLLNHPGDPDGKAIEELKMIVLELRRMGDPNPGPVRK